MNGDWHLDKKVSIFLILGFIANIAANLYGMVWYASQQESRLSALESRPDLTERVTKLEALTGEHGRILLRLNNTLDNMDTTLTKFGLEQAKRTPAIRKVYEHEKFYHKRR